MPNFRLFFNSLIQRGEADKERLSLPHEITISATDQALAQLIGEAMVGEVRVCEVVLQEAVYVGAITEIRECSPISGLSLNIGREQEVWANVIQKLTAKGVVVEAVFSGQKIVGLERV